MTIAETYQLLLSAIGFGLLIGTVISFLFVLPKY